MATVQAILKIKAHEQNFTVHGLLADLNRFFCDELRGNTYMTALAVLLISNPIIWSCTPPDTLRF